MTVRHIRENNPELELLPERIVGGPWPSTTLSALELGLSLESVREAPFVAVMNEFSTCRLHGRGCSTVWPARHSTTHHS